MKNELDNYNYKQAGLLRSFLDYLKSPGYFEDNMSLGANKKFRNVFKLWSFSIVVTFFVGVALSYLMSRTGYDESQHSVVDLFLNYPIIVFILMAFVWGPITEEMTFRMGLKYSPYRLGYTFVFLLSIVVSALIVFFENFHNGISDLINAVIDSFGSLGILYYGMFIIFGGLVLGKIFKHGIDGRKMAVFYSKNFSYLFYFSALLFAIVHLFNFTGFEEIWYLAPLLVAPQFFLGLVLAYVRMFYGLRWSILLHFLHNSLITAPAIIFSMLSDELLLAIESGSDIDAMGISTSDSLLILSSLAFTVFLLLAILCSFIVLLREYYKKRSFEYK